MHRQTHPPRRPTGIGSLVSWLGFPDRDLQAALDDACWSAVRPAALAMGILLGLFALVPLASPDRVAKAPQLLVNATAALVLWTVARLMGWFTAAPQACTGDQQRDHSGDCRGQPLSYLADPGAFTRRRTSSSFWWFPVRSSCLRVGWPWCMSQSGPVGSRSCSPYRPQGSTSATTCLASPLPPLPGGWPSSSAWPASGTPSKPGPTRGTQPRLCGKSPRD